MEIVGIHRVDGTITVALPSTVAAVVPGPDSDAGPTCLVYLAQSMDGGSPIHALGPASDMEVEIQTKSGVVAPWAITCLRVADGAAISIGFGAIQYVRQLVLGESALIGISGTSSPFAVVASDPIELVNTIAAGATAWLAALGGGGGSASEWTPIAAYGNEQSWNIDEIATISPGVFEVRLSGPAPDPSKSRTALASMPWGGGPPLVATVDPDGSDVFTVRVFDLTGAPSDDPNFSILIYEAPKAS